MSKRLLIGISVMGMMIVPLVASAVAISHGTSKIVRLPKTAILMGKVEVGPRCPVEPCRVPMGDFSRPSFETVVRVYSTNRDPKIVQEAKIDRKGNYRMVLPSGKYVLNIFPNQWEPQCLSLIGPCPLMVGHADVPREILVKPGINVENINIDTGIRAVEIAE